MDGFCLSKKKHVPVLQNEAVSDFNYLQEVITVKSGHAGEGGHALTDENSREARWKRGPRKHKGEAAICTTKRNIPPHISILAR